MTDRHDAVVYAVADMLRDSNHSTHIQCHPRGPKDSPDIEVVDFPQPGNAAFVEVSIVCPTQAGLVRRASGAPLAAAQFREAEKRGKYAQLLRQSGFAIFPAVLESTGAFGRELQRIVDICTAKVTQVWYAETALDRTWASRTSSQYWTQRIAVSFWRGAFQMDRVVREARRRFGYEGPTSPAPASGLSGFAF